MTNASNAPQLKPGDKLQYHKGELWLDAIVLGKVVVMTELLVIGIDATHPEVAEMLTEQEYEGRQLKITCAAADSEKIRPPF
ncbi:MAG: hypothetical protein F6K00_19655 [Leptolyngbya sp. SIOISBB]|nr:hypothetical protein [Leptolyngbya sp. SIOISBB]